MPHRERLQEGQFQDEAVIVRQLCQHRRTLSGGGLCFFTSAWQPCGLAGPPGFGLYPELVRGHDGASFLVGQALAVNIFALLGFAFLLLATRFAGRPNDSDGSAHQ